MGKPTGIIFRNKTTQETWIVEIGQNVLGNVKTGMSMARFMDTVKKSRIFDGPEIYKDMLALTMPCQRRLVELNPTVLPVENNETGNCLVLFAILPLMLVVYFLLRRFRSSKPSPGLPSPRPRRLKKHGWSPDHLD